MSTIPLNGDAPLGYRICNSDRPLGDSTPDADGFIVLNQSDGSVFVAEGGVWTTGSFPADLLAAWNATIVGINPPGSGYRIGTSDRAVGHAAAPPENFLVINTTDNKVFQVQSGLWADITSSFSPTTLSNLIAAWQAA